MIEVLLARLLIGFFVRPRPERTRPGVVDDASCEAATTAEREKIAAWLRDRPLPSSVEVDDGCDGRLPEGVTITVHTKDADRNKLAELHQDIDLHGSLRAIRASTDRVRLIFVPLRSTEVYDIALRRIEEVLAPPKIAPREPLGPYR